MEQVKDQALQKYAKTINAAENVKDAILKTAEFDEKYNEAKELQSKEVIEEEKEETFEFTPEEVQPIVNRGKIRKSLTEKLEEQKNKAKAEEEKTIIKYGTNEKDRGEK